MIIDYVMYAYGLFSCIAGIFHTLSIWFKETLWLETLQKALSIRF